MKKQANRMFSILLTIVMLLTLLPAPAQAGLKDDPIIPVPTTLTFTTKPQSGTALNTEDYTVTWAINKAADMIVLEIQETNRLTGATSWKQLKTLTGTSGTITLPCPTNDTQVSASGLSTYRISAGIVGETEADTELAVATFTVTWLEEQTYTVTVNGGTGSGEYAEGKPVTITAADPVSGKAFKEWDGADGLTFTEGSATTATATFTMPAKDVELTAVYQRVKPDTTVVRPAGSGTEDDPFKISTVGELYWFTGFTNNYVAVGTDFAVERNEACAILMNDITVNPELLTESYGLGVEASLLASWSPISYLEPYCGTFDGNGHTISGLYYCEISSFQTFAFIAEMGEGGVIKDLTLEDTYFYPEYNSSISRSMPRAAGIVGFAGEGTVENCRFDGVVGAGSTSYYGGGAGGIAYSTDGVIKNCTTKGRVIGQASFADNAGGARVGGIVGTAYGTAVVSDCTNDAEVTCWDNDTAWGSAGGIVGYLAGTVRDCRNRGVISGQEKNYAGGIVGRAAGAEDQYAVISRCWNEANFTGSGIVAYIHDEYGGEECTTVKNCYNAGSVTNGIVGKGWGSGISIAYCHNWGTVTEVPVYKVKYVGDTTVVENCFYRDIDETDSMAGTTAMSAEQFADGTVLALLDNGHWTQGEDDEYPVLGDPPVSISGKVTVTGTSAAASVTVEELSGKAILIIAQYSGGQMKAVQTVSVTADGTFAPTAPFTHVEGCTYKAFLVNADTYVPLCAAAPLSE